MNPRCLKAGDDAYRAVLADKGSTKQNLEFEAESPSFRGDFGIMRFEEDPELPSPNIDAAVTCPSSTDDVLRQAVPIPYAESCLAGAIRHIYGLVKRDPHRRSLTQILDKDARKEPVLIGNRPFLEASQNLCFKPGAAELNLPMPVVQGIDAAALAKYLLPGALNWRRDIHEHPLRILVTDYRYGL